MSFTGIAAGTPTINREEGQAAIAKFVHDELDQHAIFGVVSTFVIVECYDGRDWRGVSHGSSVDYIVNEVVDLYATAVMTRVVIACPRTQVVAVV